MPKPNGAGIALEEDVVTGHVPGVGRDLMEVHPSVLGVHHALGHAGGPGGRVDEEHVVGSVRPVGQVTNGGAWIGGLPVGVDHDVMAERATRGLQHRHQFGGRAAAVLRERDQGVGSGEAEEVAQLVVTGAVAEAHDRQARPLGRDEGDVDRDPVGEEDRNASSPGQPGAGEDARERRGPDVVVGPGGATAVSDQGGGVGPGSSPPGDHIAHRGVAPPPVGPVVGGDGGIGLHRILLLRRAPKACP